MPRKRSGMCALPRCRRGCGSATLPPMPDPSSPPPSAPEPRIEWPTLAVAAAVYGACLLVTWFHADLPAWLLPAAGARLVDSPGSLPHDATQGHPHPRRALTTPHGSPPLRPCVPSTPYSATHPPP